MRKVFSEDDLDSVVSFLIAEDDDSSDPSRRDFLKRVASGAASGGIGGVAKSLVGGAVGEVVSGAVGASLDHISDEELAETPESEWIHLISPIRLRRMVDSGVWDATSECALKIHKVLVYGLVKKQYGKTMQHMLAAIDKAGLNPKAVLGKAVEENWLYLDASKTAPGTVSTRIIDNLEKIGYKPDDSLKRHIFKNEYASADLQRKQLADEKRKAEERRVRADRENDRRLASSMHQPFEHKLNIALGLVMG